MVRGWLLVAVVLLLGAGLVGGAPHKEREGGAEAHEDASYPHRAWIWIKHAARKVKGWLVGDHSLFNQLWDKLKGNRTISVLGKQVTFTLPDPSSTSKIHYGTSFSSFMDQLKNEPALRVLIALYINISIFIAVYGYLIARHIMMSINQKKAAQPEKERERRRQAERKKMVKKMARASKGGAKNLSMFSPPLSTPGTNDETVRSTDFEEEIVMENYTAPSSPIRQQQLVEDSVYTTPNQTAAR